MVTFNGLIAEYVSGGINYVDQLNPLQKREIVAALIRDLNPLDSGVLLGDIGSDTKLLADLISDMIATNGNAATTRLLIDELKNSLLTKFDEEIDYALEMEYTNRRKYPFFDEELFFDNRDRARDMNQVRRIAHG